MNRYSPRSPVVAALLCLCFGLSSALAGAEPGSTAELDPLKAEQLQARIQEIQSAGGAYDVALIEASGDLAAYYSSIGNHAEAAALYSDVLQLSRISEGLYSPQQLQILPLLIESKEQLGEWEQVDDYRYLLFHTQGRIHEPGSSEQVAAIRDWGDWKLRAWREGLVDSRSGPGYGLPADLDELRQLYDDALEMQAAYNNGASAAVRLDLLYGRARTELEIARHVTRIPRQAYRTSVPRYVDRRVCSNRVDQNGNTERICWTERVQDPNWRSALRDEQRRNMDRARLRAQRAAGDLQQFLDSDKALDADDRDTYHERYQQIEEELSGLQRDARRALLRNW